MHRVPVAPSCTVVFIVLCWSTSTFGAETTVNDDHAERMQRGLELFRDSVRSTLARHCVECHGAKNSEGGLNLLTRAGLLAGGDSGPAIVSGRPAESRLIRLVTHRAQPQMPFDRPKLSASQIEALHAWIENEAPYSEALAGDAIVGEQLVITDLDRRFWSFLPLAQPALPTVEDPSWSVKGVDHFVVAGFDRHDLAPVPPASREILIRRVKLDLLGLPPTLAEVRDFVTDDRPDAWTRLIDRLLASPHYGERWGRHWLDVVRFAESYGFEHDLDNLNAYHYRDFVIQALNENMPYDQFVRWQIAGDELAPEEPRAWMATGFLAAGVRNADIAKVRVEQERYDELDDIASTIGTAMLGFSIGCARCHDHKFDPLTQENYYRFVATFQRTVRGEVELEVTAGQPATKVLVASEGITPLPRIYNPPPAFYDKTWFLRRGDVKLKEHEVAPGFVEVLTSPERTPAVAMWANRTIPTGDKTHHRSRLAEWITDSRHGAGALLARVIVNRVWQHHFGRGIVATPNDFGRRSAKPTHPALLEWLAWELVQSGWDVKHLHRVILSSAAWRQKTLADSSTTLKEELFHGHKLRRLEAEVIRDAMLATSNTLDARLYGPGTLAAEHPRRSIYFRVKRSQLVPMMTLFDAPDPLQSIGRRQETTVAPQSLVLMNGKHVNALAMNFARVVLEEARNEQPSVLVRLAIERALGRVPTDSELSQSVAFLRTQQAEYSTPPLPLVRPPADDAIVAHLDATELASASDGPPGVRRWGDDTVFSAITDELPVLEPQATPQGKPAVRFGPQATVLRGDNPQLNFGTNDFTMSVIFRLDENAGDDNHIFGKDSYSGADQYSGYFLQHIHGSLKFCTRQIVTGGGHSAELLTESFIRRGQWYRVTGVRRAGVLSLYVDDAESAVVSRAEPTPIDVNNDVGFKIGDMDASPSSPFHGSIAELIVFDRALTPDDVCDCHDYLRQKYLRDDDLRPLEMALADFCQALFCLNEFIYIE